MGRVTRRQFIGMATMTVAGGLLTACAQPTPTPEPTPAPTAAAAATEPAAATAPAATAVPATEVPTVAAKQVTLTVSLADWNPDVQNYIDKEAVPDFQTKFPGRQVKVNYSDWNRFNEELTTAFAGGVAPDVFQGGAVWAPQMAQRNWALPLDDLIKTASTDWEWADFYPALQDDVTIEGKVLAVPYRMDTRPMWYREDILKEAGVEVPTTWDEMITAAKACAKMENGKITREGWHFADPVASGWQNDWQAYVIFLDQAGGMLLSDDGKECLIDQQPAIDTLQFLVDMIYKHNIMPYPGFEPQGDKSALMLGTAAMLNGGSDVEVRSLKFSPETAGFIKAALPLKGPAGQFTHTWVNKYFIAKTAKDPQEAWALLEYLTAKPTLQKYDTLAGYISPRKSAADSPDLTPSMKVCMNATAMAKVFPKYYRLLDIFRPMANALAEALSNKTAPKEALTTAATEIRKILAEG